MASTGASATMQLVQRIVAQRVAIGGYDKLLSKVKITSADNGIVKALMTVEKEHTNVGGTLHGGMAAYLVDSLSTLALATCPEAKNYGVSVNINMVFIKGAPIGQEVEIVSKVDKTGGKLAFLSVDILNKSTGELLAQGSHTKFVGLDHPGLKIPR